MEHLRWGEFVVFYFICFIWKIKIICLKNEENYIFQQICAKTLALLSGQG